MSPIFKLKTMNPQQKARVAMTASRAERQILMRDHNAEVLNALLNHPRIEEGEVLEVVKSPHTNSAIMKRVADNKKWMGNQDIRIAVVRSPKTPTPLAIKHLPTLPIRRAADPLQDGQRARGAAQGSVEDLPGAPRQARLASDRHS